MLIDTEKVKDARLRKGLLIQELAEAAGLSLTSTARVCATGKGGIIVGRSVAKALRLKLADIIIET